MEAVGRLRLLQVGAGVEDEEERRYEREDKEEDDWSSNALESLFVGGEEVQSGGGSTSFLCSSSSQLLPAQNECLLRGPGGRCLERGSVKEVSTSLWGEDQQGLHVSGRECLLEED